MTPWQRLHEIVSLYKELNRAEALLAWDQQTYMPKASIETRANTAAHIERLAHETLTSTEVGDLLTSLENEVKDMPDESDQASVVRITRRVYDQAVKLPTSLVSELAKATAHGQAAWQDARENNDFNQFQPHLKRIVALQIEKAAALGYEHDPYDALLDLYEPAMTTQEVDDIFTSLKTELVPLVQAISTKADAVDDAVLKQDYPSPQQLDFTLEVIASLGFDLTRGRQDLSAHPFTIGISPTDVRLTTRVDPHHVASALYASIHEAGHGLYEQGLPVEHSDTLLGDAISLGIHESQSRLWENVIGRSRGFWHHFLPRMKTFFPQQLATADIETLYRAVNKVQYPSPIRVEADEVNYNLHIFLRFELERALITGDLTVDDLPTAWNEKSRAYLGYTPKNYAEGVLQDVHWSAGLFGYFPTYSLGTILAVQLYNQAVADHPQIPQEIMQGEFGTINHWMKHHIYRHGSRYTPGQLVEKATGNPLDPIPYISYVKEKYQDLYNV